MIQDHCEVVVKMKVLPTMSNEHLQLTDTAGENTYKGEFPQAFSESNTDLMLPRHSWLGLYYTF